MSSEAELEKTGRHITNFMMNNNCIHCTRAKEKIVKKKIGNKANNIKIHFLQIPIEFNASSQRSKKNR